MSQEWIYTIVYLAWLAGAACFVLGLHQMNSPATGRERQPAERGRHGVAVVRDAHLPRSPVRAA